MNNMNNTFDPNIIKSRLEEIEGLAEKVKKQEAVVKSQLKSNMGRLGLWLANKTENIPQWAKDYITVSKQFELAVKELEGVYQGKIPEKHLKKIKTSTQLSKAVQTAKTEPELVESLQILEENQKTVSRLAKVLNAGRYLEALEEVPGRTTVDPKRLLTGESRIKSSKQEWQLNMGLLMNIYKVTNDPELKKQISFLVLNYLAKAAPIELGVMTLSAEENAKLDQLFQLGLFQKAMYHREEAVFEGILHQYLNEELAFSPLQGHTILTDTADVAPLLPTKFSVLPNADPMNEEELVKGWSEGLTDALVQHFANTTDLDSILYPPVLLDLTSLIGQDIHTHGDTEKNQQFNEKLLRYKSLFDQAASQAAKNLKEKYPDLCRSPMDEKKLEVLIRANHVCACITQAKNTGVIRPFNLFKTDDFKKYYHEDMTHKATGKKISEQGFAAACRDYKENFTKTALFAFVNQVGIRLGGVRAREQVFDFMDLPTLLEKAENELSWGKEVMTEYAPVGKNVLYFRDPSAFLNTEIFKRFESHFSFETLEQMPTKPALILGQSTLDLVKGLLAEIPEDKWIRLNADPQKRQIIQTSLFRLLEHLTIAENNMSNFTKFTQAIELAHCEIATLLAITTPFNENDFSEIFNQQLYHVPPELRNFVKSGITKSAMNTFAGINAAIISQQPHLERVYGKGSYFEEIQFIGDQRSTEEVLENPKIDHVDLYVGEFNHNISLDQNLNEYQATDIIGEVEALLAAKPNTEHMTVAVDCTIDFLHSKRANALLEHFSKEIQEGKLNFVFFRSGQKFDMLGMDNYYGAPFYMINNGTEHWKPFDDLTSRDTYKTDNLTTQWLSLINKYAPQATDEYRKQIFDNARALLNRVPESLKPGNNSFIKICEVADDMEPTFIDIKLLKPIFNEGKIEKMLFRKFIKNNAKVHGRSSFGFYHPNINFIRGLDDKLNIRINPGLNSEDVELLVEFLDDLAKQVEEEEKKEAAAQQAI